MRLQRRAAVVTGGGSGLGALLCERLAAAGATVVVADRDGAAASATAQSIRDGGGEATAVTADVCDDADIARLVAVADGAVDGGLGVWVNNAGGWTSGGDQFPDAPADAWSRSIDLNLRAPMASIQAARPALAARGGGVVVNVSSSAALGDRAYGSPEYAACKAGLIRLTTALAGLAVSDGVRANCVVPDWIGLPRAHEELAAMSAEQRATAPRLIPPDEVLDAVMRLIDDDTAVGRVTVIR